MTITTTDRRGRLLIAGVLTLLFLFGSVLHGVSAAEAGTNSRGGHCIDSYNYADPGSDYLYASTTGKNAFPEPCAWVRVWIKHGGCTGTDIANASGVWFVSTSTTSVPSHLWVNQCSEHMGEFHIETHLLPFNY